MKDKGKGGNLAMIAVLEANQDRHEKILADLMNIQEMGAEAPNRSEAPADKDWLANLIQKEQDAIEAFKSAIKKLEGA